MAITKYSPAYLNAWQKCFFYGKDWMENIKNNVQINEVWTTNAICFTDFQKAREKKCLNATVQRQVNKEVE